LGSLAKRRNSKNLGVDGRTQLIQFSRNIIGERGHAVAQFVEALRCKPEGRGFDSRWSHWNFSLT
jgi:hypothetical protein